MKKQLLLPILIFIAFSSTAQTNSFTYIISGSATPSGFTTCLDQATQRWSNYLNITVPIKLNIILVNSSIYPFSGLTLANGRKNFTNAPFSDFMYPSSLANQLTGTELNTSEYDMDIYINLYSPLYYGTGKPPTNKQDCISLLMHEIGHGLGFYSGGYVNSSNVGSFGNVPASALFPLTSSFPWIGQDSVPSIYDKYIIKESANHLVGIAPNNSTTLGDSIKYTSNYFDGTMYATASNNGQPVKLSGGTGAFTLGVDLLHLHSSVCNSIMSYCTGLGDTVRIPANWELGILKEIGWNISVPISVNEIDTDKSTFVIYPNPSNNIINFSNSIPKENIKSIELKNILGERVAIYKYKPALDVKELPSGIYFVSIITDNFEAVQKFIKE